MNDRWTNVETERNMRGVKGGKRGNFGKLALYLRLMDPNCISDDMRNILCLNKRAILIFLNNKVERAELLVLSPKDSPSSKTGCNGCNVIQQEMHPMFVEWSPAHKYMNTFGFYDSLLQKNDVKPVRGKKKKSQNHRKPNIFLKKSCISPSQSSLQLK